MGELNARTPVGRVVRLSFRMGGRKTPAGRLAQRRRWLRRGQRRHRPRPLSGTNGGSTKVRRGARLSSPYRTAATNQIPLLAPFQRSCPALHSHICCTGDRSIIWRWMVQRKGPPQEEKRNHHHQSNNTTLDIESHPGPGAAFLSFLLQQATRQHTNMNNGSYTPTIPPICDSICICTFLPLYIKRR